MIVARAATLTPSCAGCGYAGHGCAGYFRAQALGPVTRNGALTLSLRAADDLTGERNRLEVAEVYGALHLAAALATNTLGRFDDADMHLAEAAATAVRTGPTPNFSHLFSGPVNVEIWRVTLVVVRGGGGKACEIVRAVDPNSPPASRERQSILYLELGRGMATEKATRDQAAVAFRRAEDIAPQLLRNNPFARETVANLLPRAQ